ncbi:MAG: oxidoreductase [Chloroflexi bacterium]|nr:MAG: oxidoreductase [Chloroflexota bacterium]
MPPRLHADALLIGGGVASARCARTLRRRRFQGSILLVGDETALPYNRPPLSKELLRGEVDAALIVAEPDGWYERHDVEVWTDAAVAELDVGARLARLEDGRAISFDRCLIATGAEPRVPDVVGAEHAHTPTVVLGGGFIGVEVAASLATIGSSVTVLERSGRLWAGALGETISSWASQHLADLGIDVRFGATATRLDAESAWVGDESVPAAGIVAGIGVRPREALATAAGLEVADGILVDEGRSAAPRIFAAGDVARVPHPLAEGERIRVEHWHAAREGGEAAALGMLGLDPGPPRAPWVYTEFAGLLVDVVGWAPDFDEERVFGDPALDRFAVAYVRGGRVAQLATVNGWVPVEQARAFVESRPTAASLESLAAV